MSRARALRARKSAQARSVLSPVVSRVKSSFSMGMVLLYHGRR